MMYVKAPYWFAGLLVLAVLGFWPSYFSPAASRATFGQHFHAVAMLIWLLVLIVQPWLINNRKRDVHRLLGWSSIPLAIVLVASALYVVEDNLVRHDPPYPFISLSFFWLGFSSALFFAMLYTLAILKRRNMQLHARYMAATALTFIVPGLGRLLGRLGEQTGIGFLNFQVALWVPCVVGAVMVVHDARHGGIRLPWVLATIGWLVVVGGFYLLPKFEWFGEFGAWYVNLI